jgi:uncharacterized protein with von Willebrand factor type A (vWA) domain
MRNDLTTTIVALCRGLRDRGVPVTPAESADAVRALDAVDLRDRDEVRLALRAVLALRIEDYAAFDDVFAALFAAAADPGAPRVARPHGVHAGDRAETEEEMPARALAVPRALSLAGWARPEAADDAEPLGIPAMSPHEALRRKDFSDFGAAELDEVTRVARRIALRLATRPSRRWKVVARGARVHMRRTLRQALRTGGDPLVLAFRERKPRRTKLVLLCDVSGSMELYSRFLLQFLYAMQNGFARVETFVFGTRLSRVTREFRGGPYAGALERLARSVRDWSGGTRIGACIAEFEAGWPRLVDRSTVVVVLSDGWDTGEPEVLAGALARIRRRARKLIWLNPLLGSPGYRPLTRGMQAALPHLDVFAPAHDLASLERLARIIGS